MQRIPTRVRNFSARSLRRLRMPPRPDQPSRCIKYILFFLNVIFWLLGAIILAIGIYLMIDLKGVINNKSDLFYQPSVIFLVVGGFLFVIAFFGCMGALRENTCLLAFYGGSVSLVLILLIVVAVIGYFNRNAMEKKLKESVASYRDPAKQDLQFLIDQIQTTVECCGVRSYKDWQTNIYFNCSSPGSESCGVPFSCCRKDLQTNRQCGYGAARLKFDSQRTEIGVYSKGCLTKAIDTIEKNLYAVIGVTAGLLVLIICTVCLAFSFRAQVKEVKRYAETNFSNTK